MTKNEYDDVTTNQKRNKAMPSSSSRHIKESTALLKQETARHIPTMQRREALGAFETLCHNPSDPLNQVKQDVDFE